MGKAVLELLSKEKDVYNLPKSSLSTIISRDKEYRVAIEDNGDIVFGPVGKKEIKRFDIENIKYMKVESFLDNKRKHYKVIIKDRKDVLLTLSDEIYKIKEIEMFFVVVMEINGKVKVEL